MRKFGKALSGRKNLVKALDSQIHHEFSQYKYDEDVELFLNLYQLEMEDFADTKKIVLKKSSKTHNLEINFESKSPFSQKDLKILDSVSTEKITNNFCDFNVFITKIQNNSGLFFDCCSFKSELHIKSITFSNDMKKFETQDESNFFYNGPDLEKFSPKIVDFFYNYLFEFGVDQDFCSFIETYCVDKDYRLYMAWLQKVRSLFP